MIAFVEGDEFSTRYWTEHRVQLGSREERLRAEAADNTASAAVSRMIWNGDPDVLDLLIRLAETAPSDEDAAYVGIGPLEDLLHENRDRLARPSDDLLERVDAAARQSVRFRTALSSALLVDLPPEVVRRLTRFR